MAAVVRPVRCSACGSGVPWHGGYCVRCILTDREIAKAAVQAAWRRRLSVLLDPRDQQVAMKYPAA